MVHCLPISRVAVRFGARTPGVCERSWGPVVTQLPLDRLRPNWVVVLRRWFMDGCSRLTVSWARRLFLLLSWMIVLEISLIVCGGLSWKVMQFMLSWSLS